MSIQPSVTSDIMYLQAAIDSCYRHAKTIATEIARGTGGREVALVITQLQQANHWLAQALIEMTPNPPIELKPSEQDQAL